MVVLDCHSMVRLHRIDMCMVGHYVRLKFFSSCTEDHDFVSGEVRQTQRQTNPIKQRIRDMNTYCTTIPETRMVVRPTDQFTSRFVGVETTKAHNEDQTRKKNPASTQLERGIEKHSHCQFLSSTYSVSLWWVLANKS